MTSQTIFVDDRDPRIIYTGIWERAGGWQEYKSTSHGTTNAGAQATFTFNGSSIAVFGTIGRENNNGDPAFAPVTTYRLDGGAAVPFTHHPLRGVVYRQLFYQSLHLEEGQHTLVIENTLSSKNMVWLDYLQLVSTTEQPEQTPPAHSSSPKPVLGGMSADFIKGAVMGSAAMGFFMFFMISLCICILVRRGPKQQGHRNRETLDLHNFRRNGRRPADSSAYDEQLALQAALFSDNEEQERLLGREEGTTSSSQGFHGSNSYKRVAPVESPDSVLDIEDGALIAGMSSKVNDREASPPAYRN